MKFIFNNDRAEFNHDYSILKLLSLTSKTDRHIYFLDKPDFDTCQIKFFISRKSEVVRKLFLEH